MNTEARGSGKPHQIGIVEVIARLTNTSDEALVSGGYRSVGSARAETLVRLMVDTHALALGLPADLVERLGLTVNREAGIQTSTGLRTYRVMDGLSFEISGRRWPSECLELPVGAIPVIGFVPLMAMGLQPDLPNRRLIALPESGPETYLRA